MPFTNADRATMHAAGALRDPAAIRARLHEARDRDLLGHWLHIGFAMLHLFTLPLITSVKDITFAILIVCALIRLRYTWKTYIVVVRDPVLWLFAATALMLGISILWSPDRVEGLTELKAFRVIVLPLALWPVIEAAPLLIAGFLAGVFGLDLVQLAQRLNLFGLGLEGADRARGWIHPIQSGAFNLAALAWYLAALLRVKVERDRGSIIRAIVIVGGALAAMMGLIFSGSRGVWVAALIVLPLEWVVLSIRLRSIRRGTLLLAPLGAGLALVLSLGGWRYAVERYEDARQDYLNAQDGDYTGSVGQRIVMARWAWRFFEQSPLYGRGAGSFRELSRETPEFAELEARWPGRAEQDKFTPAHPHNAYLHLLASTGVIGALLFALTLGILLVRAWREPGNHLFAGAALFVLLGWMLGTLSDCYTLNGHLFGIFGLVMALTLPQVQRMPTEAAPDAASP